MHCGNLKDIHIQEICEFADGDLVAVVVVEVLVNTKAHYPALSFGGAEIFVKTQERCLIQSCAFWFHTAVYNRVSQPVDVVEYVPADCVFLVHVRSSLMRSTLSVFLADT